MIVRSILFALCILAPWQVDAAGGQRPDNQFEYRLLATNRTSTMQKEMNQAAEESDKGGTMKSVICRQ